jgi:hypothetical protein
MRIQWHVVPSILRYWERKMASQAHQQRGQQTMTTQLTGHVAQYIAAINAFDTEAAAATFAPDAYVNDARREISGIDAIRRWITKEMVGDHVTMEVREVVEHYGETIVRSRYDGTYDRPTSPTSS